MTGSEGSKKCWGCDASTPYSQGFCPQCLQEMPMEVVLLLKPISLIPQPYLGALQMAVSDALKSVRRAKLLPKREPLPKKVVVDFNDLDLDL